MHLHALCPVSACWQGGVLREDAGLGGKGGSGVTTKGSG